MTIAPVPVDEAVPGPRPERPDDEPRSRSTARWCASGRSRRR